MGDAEKKSENWGGRRDGAGRPILPAKRRRAERLVALVTKPELQGLEQQAEKETGGNMNALIRKRLGLPE